MNKILVTEFINQQSLDRLNKVFEVYYDEKLWKNSKKISKLIRDFDCLILRNKTIVNKSFSITPVKNPIKEPNAALKANFVSELLLNSPAKAPMNGPKIIPFFPFNSIF